ncbi:hypothetical protein INT44_003414 [Umbelopsis vinacea]|uniref:BHLH domain-containing protein n=1 Tax=Umbelopsis vinacea TaxID=44442 RepID=A0A8H7UEV7_9FUNG|nr:hypothetical protein INT44_003414 [Umbelopsis vinacea]
MYSSQGISMAENYLDEMDPTLRFLPMAGQSAQSMAEFEAQLQAAMLQEQPQELHPQILNMNNMDQLMPPPDLFNFDDFTPFNPPPPHKLYEHQLPPQQASVPLADYSPYIKRETSSSVSSPTYDAVPEISRSPLSPTDQQAAMSASAPSMAIPTSTPMATPLPMSNPPSVTIPQHQTPISAIYEDPGWLSAGTPFSSDPMSMTPGAIEKPEKKVAHNAIERRYRNNINDRIAELKSVVPALVHAKLKSGNGKRNHANDEEDEDEDDNEVLDGVAVATKLNKATILRKATEYIVHLKTVAQQLKMDNAALRQIVSQLPGGQESLMRHHIHSQQIRTQQDSVRLAFERSQQKQQSADDSTRRKRRRAYDRRSQEDSDSSGPVTPPSSTGGRIFMAAFMAVSLFATSPLTTGTVQRTADDHHHSSRTSSSNSSAEKGSDMPFGFLLGHNVWYFLRTGLLIAGITYLLIPYLHSASGKHYRRIARRFKRPSGIKIPNSQKASQVEMYKALSASLVSPPPNPTSIFEPIFSLLFEFIRFMIRRGFGHDILYDADLDQEQEWTRACTWLRMSELECVGGNPLVTRISMLHSCLKTINLIETLESNGFQSFSRTYATAAIQMALAAPKFVSSYCTNYFWRLAFDFYDVDDFEQDSFQIFFVDLQEDDAEESVMSLMESDIWHEALNVMRLQTQLFHEDRIVPKIKPTSSVPLEIIANFHILRKLQPLFFQLVLLITNPNDTDVDDDGSEAFGDTRFDEILAASLTGNPTRWYALVGACVEAVWSNNVELAESLMSDIKDLPTDSAVEDQIVQRAIAYSLIARIQLQKGDKASALRVLLKARSVQLERNNLSLNDDNGDVMSIENNVILLVDFVVQILTLQTWLKLMASPKSNGQSEAIMPVSEAHGIILSMIKTLRRMVAVSPMVMDSYSQEVLDRLCKISQVFYTTASRDSGCELSDDEEASQISGSSAAKQALPILYGLF